MSEPESRPERLMSAIGLRPATKAASGRYLRSLPVRPGVRYWATSQERFREDYLGVQFYGEGQEEGRRLAAHLERAGFKARKPQSNQDTFAKAIPFDQAGEIDARRLLALRRELDAILTTGEAADGATKPRPKSFRDFMLASPLADTDLDLPSRDADWREGPM